MLAIFVATDSIPKQDMRWRNGATWAVPWLAGVGCGWGFLVILGLSVIVYVLAMKVRLTPDEVDANIAGVTAEAEEEDAELGHSG